MTRDDAKGAAKQNLALRLRPRGAEGFRGSAGYNHSIRYKNYLVHIQTEDAGSRQAAVCTHVFVEGRAVATRRTSYADRLGGADLDAFVRRLVYEQHRSTFVALRGGEFDEALDRTTVRPENRTSGIVRRAEAAFPALSTSPPGAGSRAPSGSSSNPAAEQQALAAVSAGLKALSPPLAPSFQRPATDAPAPGAMTTAWASGLRLPSTAPPSPPAHPAPPPALPLAPAAPTSPLAPATPAAPSVAPAYRGPQGPSVAPRTRTPLPSAAAFGPGLRLPSTNPPGPSSLVAPRPPTGFVMPSTVPPSAAASSSTLPPALGLRSLLTSLPTLERHAQAPPSGRASAAAGAAMAAARSEAPRSAPASPSPGAPRPSAPPSARAKALSERPFAPLPLSLRALEGYRASGVADLASGKLLASDGLVGSAALVASLREIVVGRSRALAALAIEDGACEYTLLGASSCLLLHPLPSRPGAYLYLACDQAPADLGPLRAALASAADELG